MNRTLTKTARQRACTGLIHPADGLIEGAATPSPVSAEVAGRGAVSLVSLITDKVALTAADNGWEGA